MKNLIFVYKGRKIESGKILLLLGQIINCQREKEKTDFWGKQNEEGTQ